MMDFPGEAFAATTGTGPTSLNPFCQLSPLWPKYKAPGQQTQRFRLQLLCSCSFRSFSCFNGLPTPILQEVAEAAKHEQVHIKSLSLSARSYIFRPQLAKRYQETVPLVFFFLKYFVNMKKMRDVRTIIFVAESR